jgi:uncharacterized membrane protein
MMRLKLLSSMLTLALCAASALAANPPRYRLTELVSPPDHFLTATDINSRGEVVGAIHGGPGPQAFYWHAGSLVDISDRVNPDSVFVEASGNNDRSQIGGSFIDPSLNTFRGFLLERNGRLRVIAGPPGAEHVFVNALNNREQMLGLSYDAAGAETLFFWDRGVISLFEPGFSWADLNNRGAVSGTFFSGGDRQAAIRQDGEIMLIGPPGSSGRSINDRGQVTGSIPDEDGNGTLGFVWDGEQFTLLPVLREDQLSTFAGDINDAGTIVGVTLVLVEGETQNIATLWNADHEVMNLNHLIDSRDPLSSFVVLEFPTHINDRGEILADGRDLRTGLRATYFLTPRRR